MEEQDPFIGRSIKGYRITDVLGEGGMGRVYRAEHPKIGKKVALKFLQKGFSDDPGMLSRFLTEAKAVNDIHHENVVDILDLDDTPEGIPFILMELLEGRNLSDALKAEAPFSLVRIGQIGLQICSALFAAHHLGIVHRDLKPDNIFLIKRGSNRDFVKVLDFGVAKLLDDPAGPMGHTKPGALIGTPLIMSPEQAQGEPADALTDIYALGVILFHMTTGAPPFYDKNTIQLLFMHIGAPVPSVRERRADAPPRLAALIERCLAKRKQDRFQNMLDLARELAAACQLDLKPYLGEGDSLRISAINIPILPKATSEETHTPTILAEESPKLPPASPSPKSGSVPVQAGAAKSSALANGKFPPLPGAAKSPAPRSGTIPVQSGSVKSPPPNSGAIPMPGRLMTGANPISGGAAKNAAPQSARFPAAPPRPKTIPPTAAPSVPPSPPTAPNARSAGNLAPSSGRKLPAYGMNSPASGVIPVMAPSKPPEATKTPSVPPPPHQIPDTIPLEESYSIEGNLATERVESLELEEVLSLSDEVRPKHKATLVGALAPENEYEQPAPLREPRAVLLTIPEEDDPNSSRESTRQRDARPTIPSDTETIDLLQLESPAHHKPTLPEPDDVMQTSRLSVGAIQEMGAALLAPSKKTAPTPAAPPAPKASPPPAPKASPPPTPQAPPPRARNATTVSVIDPEDGDFPLSVEDGRETRRMTSSLLAGVVAASVAAPVGIDLSRTTVSNAEMPAPLPSRKKQTLWPLALLCFFLFGVALAVLWLLLVS